MSDRKIVLPGSWFATEITRTTFLLSGASISLSGTKATVTLASHLLVTGDYVTFSGTTSTTGLNTATWGPITKTASGTYTFPCTITGSPGGTIVQEKLYFFAAGVWTCLVGANGAIEYCPNNNWGKAAPNGDGTDTTWRTLVAASTAYGRSFSTDGYSVRFRDNGTTATSYFSKVA